MTKTLIDDGSQWVNPWTGEPLEDLQKAYNPDQPRAPKGKENGGQWTSEGGTVDINTPQFKKWFEGSKIVDDSGNPLVVYHGTNKDFDTFSTDRQNFSYRFGEGSYFSEAREVSEFYAEDAAETSGKAIVKKAYLSIKNPLVVSSQPEYRDFIEEKISEKAGNSMYLLNEWSNKPKRQLLIDLGHDGVVYNFKGRKQEIVAFHPEQIKVIND